MERQGDRVRLKMKGFVKTVIGTAVRAPLLVGYAVDGTMEKKGSIVLLEVRAVLRDFLATSRTMQRSLFSLPYFLRLWLFVVITAPSCNAGGFLEEQIPLEIVSTTPAAFLEGGVIEVYGKQTLTVNTIPKRNRSRRFVV